MQKLVNGLWHVFEVVRYARDGVVVEARFGSYQLAWNYLNSLDLADLMGTVTFGIRETWTNIRPPDVIG